MKRLKRCQDDCGWRNKEKDSSHHLKVKVSRQPSPPQGLLKGAVLSFIMCRAMNPFQKTHYFVEEEKEKGGRREGEKMKRWE